MILLLLLLPQTLRYFQELLSLLLMLLLLILMVSKYFCLMVGVHSLTIANQLIVMVQIVYQGICLIVLFSISESLVVIYLLMNYSLKPCEILDLSIYQYYISQEIFMSGNNLKFLRVAWMILKLLQLFFFFVVVVADFSLTS